MSKSTSYSTKPPTALKDLVAVVFAIVFPTLVTLVYFEWLKDSAPSLQQTAYSVGKFLQFAFPIAWIGWLYRQRLTGKKEIPTAPNSASLDLTQHPPTARRIVLIGIAFGLCISISIFFVYFGLIDGTALGDRLTAMVREKIAGVGVDSFWKYAALGLFYSLIHSALEEYYWRWFVFERLEYFVSTTMANLISSLGFMAHHVILLAFFFGWQSPLTYLCSLGVAIGGGFWAWQYKRTGLLTAPWISHMLVDAGIFSLGYFLLKLA